MAPTIITDAAQGLQYLHEQGWVHRDIKPDNFLVAEDGHVKLIDFALAQRIKTGLSRLFGGRTKVQGTRSYMAPEQIRGKALDARTDIYSFGCLLYELLTGKLPFTGISPEDLLRKHLTAAVPSVMSGNKNVTPDFNDLVAQMMAKDPAQRPQSMDEFLRHFHAIRVFRTFPSRPSEPAGGRTSIRRQRISPWKFPHPDWPSNNPSTNWKPVCRNCSGRRISRPGVDEEIRKLRRELAETIKNVYDNLSPWETVQVARHKDRPHSTDYLGLVFDEFVELHGDRLFGDDRAMLCGFAKLDQRKVMVIGHEKGRTYKERTVCYFGCAHPEGYRKALQKMQLAAKFGVPVICFIDTPGAYPGIGAEERGQAWAIAENMYEMSRLGHADHLCRSSAKGGAAARWGSG